MSAFLMAGHLGIRWQTSNVVRTIYLSVSDSLFCLLSRFLRPPCQYDGGRKLWNDVYVGGKLLLFTLGHGEHPTRHAQRYNPAVSPLSWHLVPPWEYMLREIILKSVTPSQLDASIPHRRPFDASYYGGPVAAYSNDDENVILSRGNVYRLPNGHWMLCQDGCVDCEPCAVQRNPSFTWILRRIKRPPDSKPTRHDLQLTIIPQASDRFHAGSFWPNNYVYVTPRGERTPTPTIRAQRDNGPGTPPSGLENSFSEHHRRSKDLWRLTERDLNADRDGMLREDSRAAVQENVSTEKTEKEESIERKRSLENMRPRQRPSEKAAEEANQLAPRLILGTDQKGQKHLVHVVPADYPTTTTFPAISPLPEHPTSHFVEDQATHSNNTTSNRERQTYQWILHRIFNSLNTHRRSIEDFLESPTDNADGYRLSSSMDNMEVAGFAWNNRDINHKNANSDSLHLNDALPPSIHAGNEDTNQANCESRGQSQKDFNLDLGRQRRRIPIRPYFVNSENISRVSSPSPTLDNYSIKAIQKAGSGFVASPTKQIDLNDALVEKANNSSMESSSITIKRENGQLFDLERQRSGDVNREFEASRYAFRVIVTTGSPVIRSEHETLNRTTVLQMTTSKTF
ncbi:PREDICTED: uncharacterized protein LOC105562299 isoform X2 [Vollenhovia emeryi]|uniref:uncharacterized protein LOC105562299 isoform X2 n=1 Tax=Vollenhovia emeryi TaxID=411798 RepID=UPI0005F3981F|nr:PREDICTED: uncharacterized protein LOC105562299 isoform X2 [Vollenhovia emeryi]